MVAAWSCAELQMCEMNRFHAMPSRRPVRTGLRVAESRMIRTALDEAMRAASSTSPMTSEAKSMTSMSADSPSSSKEKRASSSGVR